MVTRVGADGVDIDFEHMNFGNVGSYRTQVKKLFPVFLDKLRQRLHNQGALLSVAVPARRSASDSGWEVFDYNAIGRTVDRARIMTYDYSVNSPGPIGPYAWTRNVMEYARKEFRGVPVSAGVAQYGRNWYIGTLKGSCPGAAQGLASPTSVQALSLADTYNADVQWSKDAQEFHYDYRRPYPEYGNCVALRRVWFGEARSADARLGLAKKLGLQGIAVWKLGFEDPKMWARARNVAASINPDPAKVTVSAPASAAAGSPITINARATVKGVPISNYSVTLQKRVPGKAWGSVAVDVTDSTGRASFDTTINRTLDWRVKVAPAWDWRLSYSLAKRVTVS
jgi:spore germination protein YaaH